MSGSDHRGEGRKTRVKVSLKSGHKRAFSLVYLIEREKNVPLKQILTKEVAGGCSEFSSVQTHYIQRTRGQLTACNVHQTGPSNERCLKRMA